MTYATSTQVQTTSQDPFQVVVGDEDDEEAEYDDERVGDDEVCVEAQRMSALVEVI